MNKISATQTVAGIAIVCLGSAVLAGWITHTPLLVQMRAEFVGMVVNTALCFFVLGIAFVLPALKVTGTATIQAAIGLFVLVLGALVLFEILFRIDLGIDLKTFHSWLNDGNPNPGRMAPNTAAGFMLAGLVLVAQREQSKSGAVFIQLATFTVLMLGLTGLVGYTLQLDMLYSSFKAVRMALHTACGMTLVGLGLWSGWRQAEWYRSRQYFREDEKIAFVGAALLVVITLTAGVAGFAAQQSNLEKALTSSLPTALKNQRTIFQSVVQQSVATAKSVAGRPALLRLSAAIGSDSNDSVSRAELERIGTSILASGMSGILILDPSKRELLRLGKFVDKGNIAIALDAQSTSLLLWDQTLFLNSTLPLHNSTGIIGTLIVEEPLKLITTQFSDGEALGRTGEMNMCFLDPRNKEKVLCFPQFRNPKVYQTLRLNINGKPTPMSYAVDGKTGTFKGLDYRGKNVIAAYGPLTTTGLGIVIKKDTEELFEPVREQLQWAVPLLLLLVTLGATLLRSQITPLASRLLRSERDATDKELRIRTVVDSVGDGIITLDENGAIESFNGAASAIFGYAPEEVIGSNIKMLMPPEMRGAHDAGMLRYLTGGTARVVGKKGVELQGLHKDGTIFSLELAVNEMKIGDGRRFVGIVRDISERKQAENAQERSRLALEEAKQQAEQSLQRQREMQDELVRAEKMAALGGLVAGVAHEVNTPVGVALSSATHLEGETKKVAELYQAGELSEQDLTDYFATAGQAARLVANNCHRAADLIQGFKQVAVDQSSGERREFDLAEYIDEILSSLKPNLKKSRVNVTVDCTPGIKVDSLPGALSQVITNLVMNSLAHAFDNVAVARNISISARIKEGPSDWIELTYHDDGCGIPPEHHEKIFEPFFTTRRNQGGSGLGLHIVYNIVTQSLKGRIVMTSVAGQGSTFTIGFPRLLTPLQGAAG